MVQAALFDCVSFDPFTFEQDGLAASEVDVVHDHAKFIFCGDLISGPLSPAFGQGIEDRDLATIDKQSASFTHTKYWSADQSRERLATFRNAINVLDED